MRTLLRWLSCGLTAVLLAALPASAQEPTTLTGSVLSEAGTPIGAATVMIESMGLGVLTNPQGRYLLNVPAAMRTGAPVEVRASQIGKTSQVQTITLQPGTQVLDFSLAEDPLRIEGITVTALGIERQSRTLGVSTQQLAGSEITRAEPNVVNALSGKLAGVHINNSGPQGGSTRMVIRGENSITGVNQPLFIVNGIPVDNTIGGRVGNLTDQGGYDYGNPIQDINPDDIASVTVLKGPNAAALYGSRAANGAVLIETKTGQGAVGGTEIVVSQQLTFEDELRLPDYQNVYGGGYYGDFSFYDGFGNGLYDEADESWGPPLDVGLMIPQWFSPYDPVADARNPSPWVSHPSNVDDFFELGTTATTNVSVAGASENLYGRAAFSRMDLNGMQPGHKLKRTSISFAGALSALERLTLNTSVQYVASEGVNRPGVGYGSDNIMSGFVWWNRNIDTKQLKRLYNETRPMEEPTIGGFPYSWTTLYWLNPYFRAYEHRNTDERDRLIGQITTTMEITPWLTAQLRSGTDWYRDVRLKTYAANPQTAIAGDYTTNPLDSNREYIDADGSFGHWNIDSQETNTDFLLIAEPELSLPFSSTLTFGGNRRDYERKNDYTWVGELTAPGIYDVSNAASIPDRTTNVARKRVNSLYGQAEFSYEDYLFLTLTGRNDWSSTLPKDNRSYFYPSVSSSLVFTDLMDPDRLEDGVLSYGKLRASWAQVGNDTDPYRLRNTFLAGDLWGGLPSFSVPGRLENPDLKPEITESWELGTELGFLNSRLGLDLTYYVEETRDQLMPVQLSATTGFASRMLNAGTVENKGWEVLLRGTPYTSSSFHWESTLTWAKNDSKVVRLAEGVEGLELSLQDFWGASLYAREGEPLGQIVGSAYRRDPDGNIVVDEDGGYPLWDNGQVIGNVNPDWRAGWANEFTFRGVRLGVLFDMRQGGEIYSVTNTFGRVAGQLKETLPGRCDPEGGGYYPLCTPETGIVFDGVNEVSPGVYQPNTTVIDAETFWTYNYYVEENNLEDASYIKLREVSLSYPLPSSWVSRWGVQGVDLSLVGRNLALWTDARHIDPETALEGTNVQGFEYGQMPSARSLGLNVTVRF